MFEVVGTLLAALLLVSIAFPNLFLQLGDKKKKKMVGSSYWGIYEGCTRTSLSEEKRITVPKPARRWNAVYGSEMYEGGKAVSRRGA